MRKIGMISLGCAKNQVDSEMILGILTNNGYEIVGDAQDADLLIVNTCGFINSAKEEAIETINDLNDIKKPYQKLVVCGCYAQRYKEKLISEFPFVDLVLTFKDYPHFLSKINALFEEQESDECLSYHHKVLISSQFTPYIRISDGCNNRCSYCAIPLIRGKYISRPMEDIIAEIKEEVSLGAKEINLISQDTTNYGTDLYKENKFVELLKEIEKIEGIFLIRILYMYPDLITDELIDLIKNSNKIAHYFDVPIQHSSSKVLKLMNRRGDHKLLENLLLKIKREIPDAILRTTVIVGFPGECDEDFADLLDFVKKIEFDHLGCFMYSKEEDTLAYNMENEVLSDVINRRYNEIMQVQKSISYHKNHQKIGKEYMAIVDFKEEETNNLYLRSYMDAPDEVDGYIVTEDKKDVKIGDVVKVKIVSAFTYDLFGKII